MAGGMQTELQVSADAACIRTARPGCPGDVDPDPSLFGSWPFLTGTVAGEASGCNTTEKHEIEPAMDSVWDCRKRVAGEPRMSDDVPKGDNELEGGGAPDGIGRVPWTIAELRVMVAELEERMNTKHAEYKTDIAQLAKENAQRHVQLILVVIAALALLKFLPPL